MKKKKLDLLVKINQYLVDHDMVVDEKNIDKIINVCFEFLETICSDVCGGLMHCSDGCPLYYLMMERKEIDKNE